MYQSSFFPDAAANGRDDAPAVIFGDEVVHYGALRARVADVVRALEAKGIEKGERVGLVRRTHRSSS
jgi:acyl-coenzyme A synthetase/AMP-(fatty) acid ligase